MPTRSAPVRLALCLLLFAVAGCASEPEEPTVPEPLEESPDTTMSAATAAPETIVEGVDDVLGRWAVMEQAGTAPEDVYYVTFTREGEYVVEDETGAENVYSFRPAGDDLLAITDATGTNRYAYEIEGRTLVLTVPGTETRTVYERRE